DLFRSALLVTAGLWVSAILVACGDDVTNADANPPDAGSSDAMVDGSDVLLPLPPEPPPGTGPFRVGYRTFDYTYERPDGMSRTLKIDVWYPSSADRGMPVTYVGLFPDPHTLADVELATPPTDGFPVHVHSHGSQGFAAASHDVMRHFASHGWVSIAPDHVGHTLGDTPNPIPTELYYLRPWDISATLDALDDLDASDPLAGHVRTDRVLLSGHSFGVLTSWSLMGATYDLARIGDRCDAGDVPSGMCSQADRDAFAAATGDSRIAAGIVMAGRFAKEWYGEDGYRAVGVPVLSLTGGLDDVGAAGLFEEIEGVDYTWVEIATACHTLFSVGACTEIGDEEGWTIINAYALAFGQLHLLDDRTGASILDGSTPVSELATVQVKAR
ncbi:MAG: hypothetical protein AAGF12_38880, partial [Myxococcota bacterium]